MTTILEAKAALLVEFPLGFDPSPGNGGATPNYVRYYYDLVLDGGADDVLFDNETTIDVFFLDSEDRGAWGWTASQYALVIWTTNDGFIDHRVLNETQYNDLVEVCTLSLAE